MNDQDKTKEELLKELRELEQKYNSLKALYDKDKTEREQVIEALSKSQQLIEGIINTISVRVFWKDLDSVYLGCNLIFAQDAGFSDPNDLIGKNDFQMGWSDQAELYRIGDRQVMESGIPILLNEEPQTTPEGNTIILLTNKLPLKNSMGEIYGILGTSMNITERTAAVQKIKLQNEELQKLNSEKDKFFSIIAHDLKNPFNTILGFSELLVENAAEKNCEETVEFAKLILQSSRRAMDLLLNLMEWSRSQTGRMNFNPEHFNLADIVDKITLLLTDGARQKTITISNTLQSDIPVYADKAMISTILRNLISNAIKFSEPGEEISITVTENQNEFIVAVSDTGIGISKEIIGKLFQIDQNMTTPGTQNEQGTGLGLILCKEFIEKHGGEIWVESKEGKGSTFYFTIPNNDGQKEKIADDAAEVSKGSQINKLKILIAEDDEASEILMSTELGKFSREIITVRTGKETVEACRNNPDIDLILMDIQMPEMNGYDATRRIREFNKDVVIIAQTASGLSGDREKAIVAGCNDYISKPVNKNELLALIQKYFGK